MRQHPVIALLRDAETYARENDGNHNPELSGEELRTLKSIRLFRKFLQPGEPAWVNDEIGEGYNKFKNIVEEAVSQLGHGDRELGIKRYEEILATHDFVKSKLIQEICKEHFGVIDHDVGLKRFVANNFEVLRGKIPHESLLELQRIYADSVIRGFILDKPESASFNYGLYVRGCADYKHFRENVGAASPLGMAEFIIDVLGADGHRNPDGPPFLSDKPLVFNTLADGIHRFNQWLLSGDRSEEATYTAWQELSYPQDALERLGLTREDPADKALTRLAFMGSEHQKKGTDEALQSIALLRREWLNFSTTNPNAYARIVQVLGDDNYGAHFEIVSHAVESIRGDLQKKGIGPEYAWRYLFRIIDQLTSFAKDHHGTSSKSLTISLDRTSFDWSALSERSDIKVVLGQPQDDGNYYSAKLVVTN